MSEVNPVEENPNLSRIEHDPLSVKTTRVAVIGGILLIAVALGIGLILHLRSLISQYTVHAFDVATYARMAVVHGEVPPWEIAEEVVNIYRSLGCRGFARVDFFVTADNTVVFNEINTVPGFTRGSIYSLMFEKSGVSYETLVEELISMSEK